MRRLSKQIKALYHSNDRLESLNVLRTRLESNLKLKQEELDKLVLQISEIREEIEDLKYELENTSAEILEISPEGRPPQEYLKHLTGLV